MMLPASRFATPSSSPENKFPATMARENLFLACRVEILVNAGCSWPLTSPRTILCQSQLQGLFEVRYSRIVRFMMHSVKSWFGGGGGGGQ